MIQTMNQQKLQQWILKQDMFRLTGKWDGMSAWELAGIIIREGQDDLFKTHTWDEKAPDETLQDKMEADVYAETNLK